MAVETTLFRTRVPARRLKKVEKILGQLGMKTGDAVNMLLAQIELREGLPFDVSMKKEHLLSSEEQGEAWTNALGKY
jgi:addiction module RelB/DinJ family antitoxin